MAGVALVGVMASSALASAQARGAKPAATAKTPPPTAASAAPVDGKRVFLTICATCHMPNGEGVPEKYPPLAGSEWVADDEAKLVRIILHGLTGPVEVAGETFDGLMPPWGPTLKDAEIAAVASYVRSTWGNKTAPVTTAKVMAIRTSNKTRKTPWTAAELARIVTVTK